MSGPIFYICIYIYIYIYISVRLFLWKWPKVGCVQPNNSLKKPSWVVSGVWTENLPILIEMFWPARPLPQIFKLIGHLIRNIFMEKVCRKSIVKTSFMRIFNLVNSPKQSMHIWDIWKYVFFERDHVKGNLIFSFPPCEFLWRKFWKAKMPRISYQSIELQDILTKREGKKLTKDWINRGKKRFSKFLNCFL